MYVCMYVCMYVFDMYVCPTRSNPATLVAHTRE
jgi:hypothetical protein